MRRAAAAAGHGLRWHGGITPPETCLQHAQVSPAGVRQA
jgi:hypothetical protein